MAINESVNQKQKNEVRSMEIEISHVSSPVLDRAYEMDVLSQFKANLQQVEDLNSRLRYVLSEVNSLIKKA